VDPDRPTVVLVHGAMDRAASFGRVMRRLVDTDVIAYDRRGYAESLGAGVATTLAEHAADLARVADWSGAGSVVAVGHSLGGTIALLLAASDPPGLVGLGAFESPVPSLPGYRSEGGDLALAAAAEGGPAAGADAFYRLLVGDRTWDRLRSGDRDTRRAEGAALVAELRDLRRPGGCPDLSAVRVPVVAGAGSASPAAWRLPAEELVGHLAHAALVEVVGAGHGAHLSYPDEFARYVGACAAGPHGATSHGAAGPDGRTAPT
jgi:pimeloyl-ACP methyl ester carboxylesterase